MDVDVPCEDQPVIDDVDVDVPCEDQPVILEEHAVEDDMNVDDVCEEPVVNEDDLLWKWTSFQPHCRL